MPPHPQIFNGDAVEASAILGIPRTTLLGWASCSVMKNVVSKWFDLVAKLTWAEVKEYFSGEIIVKYSMVEDESRIDLSKFRELNGDNVILSKFCGIPPARRARLSKRSANAQARGEKTLGGIVSIENKGDKMHVGLISPKYKDTEWLESFNENALYKALLNAHTVTYL